jgi:pimeloyl-ACP methyl ester carboxylesterase
VLGRALDGQANVRAVDLRGRGQSRDLPGPYGLDAHVRDLLAVLDAEGLRQAVFMGHSLGAYIVARLGALHPERVRALVLVDGGLRIPGSQVDDPQAFLDAFLGVTLARLALRFTSPEEYYDWWRAHPALVDSDVSDDDLKAYADNDLVGAPPELRSAVREEAVRQDGADVLLGDDDAARLRVPATLLCAPFGLQGEPNPMQPLELVRRWVDGGPELRVGRQVSEVNHYTIVMGAAGASAVADAVRGVL